MNPLKAITDAYDETVKEQDKKGFADDYAAITDEIRCDLLDSGYEMKDIEFLDGYFLFGMGTNSVVHFHVKNCPNWLFGIWYTPVDSDPDEKFGQEIKAEFFCQYEDYLDKFKPTCGIYSEESPIYLKEKDRIWHISGTILRILKFISRHPLKAWYKGWTDVDYNVSSPSRIYMILKAIGVKIRFKLNKYLLKHYNDKFISALKEALHYSPTVIYPYEDFTIELNSSDLSIYCKVEDNTPDEYIGCFNLCTAFADEEEDIYYKQLETLYDKIEKRTKFFNMWWNNCYNWNFIIYYRQKDLEDEVHS